MNFTNQINKINHESLRIIYRNLGNISNDIVFNSYPKLLEFVKRSICIKDKITLIGIAHVVYGWMPTMLNNINKELIENNILINDIWDKIMSGSLEEEFLISIKNITNNSIIGGSKLLHFINPKNYAIIDSNILKYILNRENINYYCSIDNYVIYMNKLRELENNELEIDQIKKIFYEYNTNLYEFSNLRYIEMALFYAGKYLR
jgi:hypothetical protein